MMKNHWGTLSNIHIIRQLSFKELKACRGGNLLDIKLK